MSTRPKGRTSATAARETSRKRASQARRARRGRQHWLLPVAAAGIAAVALVGAILLLNSSHGRGTHVAAADALLAEANSGGAVHAERGGVHTVFHSSLLLPTASSPRADGKYTVVWFSGTWCEFCAHMQSFVNTMAAQYRDRMVLIEKSVDDAPTDASHFHVRGTPTFVVLDASGHEVSRFGFIPHAPTFAAQLERIPKPS